MKTSGKKEPEIIVERDYITKVQKNISDLTNKEKQNTNLVTNLWYGK